VENVLIFQSRLEGLWAICKDDIDAYQFEGRSDLIEYVDGNEPRLGTDWSELDYVSIFIDLFHQILSTRPV
jgi:hypothetical protein